MKRQLSQDIKRKQEESTGDEPNWLNTTRSDFSSRSLNWNEGTSLHGWSLTAVSKRSPNSLRLRFLFVKSILRTQFVLFWHKMKHPSWTIFAFWQIGHTIELLKFSASKSSFIISSSWSEFGISSAWICL